MTAYSVVEGSQGWAYYGTPAGRYHREWIDRPVRQVASPEVWKKGKLFRFPLVAEEVVEPELQDNNQETAEFLLRLLEEDSAEDADMWLAFEAELSQLRHGRHRPTD